jgi:hypothetical protein
MDVYKSMIELLSDPVNPLDQLVYQNMLFGTKRTIGPFPSSVQFGLKLRGDIGFDHFGTSEAISDPRTWQNIHALYDLEKEYMHQSNVGNISFTCDTDGDTSKGGSVDKKFSGLDLNNPKVQERYYDRDSEKGFSWVANVKHEWDIEDVFHSRFTVPPKPIVAPLAQVLYGSNKDENDLETENRNTMEMIPNSVPTAQLLF